jgi:hypothetical protein
MKGDGNVTDMSDWDKLDKHLRKDFELESDPKKLCILVKATITRTGKEPIDLFISNQPSLYNLRTRLRALDKGELLDEPEVKLYVQKRTLFGKETAGQKPRKGRHAKTEKKARDLGEVLYGSGTANQQQQEGEWTSEANDFMARNPGELRKYLFNRKVIAKALGSTRYCINPRRCLCPFVSLTLSGCKETGPGTVELSRINEISSLVKHLKKRHARNPAAQIAAQRIEKAKARGAE